MAGTSYRNVDVPLDAVIPDASRRPIDGAEPGNVIYGVYIMRQNFTDNPIPAGAQVKLYFGQNDEIILSDDVVSFKFACGHDGGVFFSNAVALAGKRIRLLVDFSGFGLDREL